MNEYESFKTPNSYNMNKLTGSAALAVFSALGSDRVALGNIPTGTTFKIELSSNTEDITSDNVSEVEAHLIGKALDTLVSVYKIAGIVLVDDKSGVSYQPTTVTRNGVVMHSTRELTRNGFNTLANAMKKMEDIDDVSVLEYRVLGKIGLVNRFSTDPDKRRRLRYQPECYEGFPAYNMTMQEMTNFNLKTFNDAQTALLSSNLRPNVELEPEMVQTTIVCELVSAPTASAPTTRRRAAANKDQ